MRRYHGQQARRSPDSGSRIGRRGVGHPDATKTIMNIDAMTFRAIAEAVLGEAMLTGRAAALTGREARAIVQLTYLASGADLEDSSEEETLREQLGRHICALAEISFDSVPWPSPLPIDGEERVAWLTTLGG